MGLELIKNQHIRYNSFMRFLLGTTKSSWEIWPLWACLGFWSVLFGATVYHSFAKPEVWINRTRGVSPPWEWDRQGKDQYGNRQGFLTRQTFIVLHPEMWQRIPELDKLQKEMMEARKAQN